MHWASSSASSLQYILPFSRLITLVPFLLTSLVRQVLIQFQRPSVCQSKRRLSQENLMKITLHAMDSGLCRHAHSCKGKVWSHVGLAHLLVPPCVFMCVCMKMCVCSLSTKGHTQPYSSAISQSRNKHPHDNSDSALAKITENRKGTQSWKPELLAAAVQQSIKFRRINTERLSEILRSRSHFSCNLVFLWKSGQLRFRCWGDTILYKVIKLEEKTLSVYKQLKGWKDGTRIDSLCPMSCFLSLFVSLLLENGWSEAAKRRQKKLKYIFKKIFKKNCWQTLLFIFRIMISKNWFNIVWQLGLHTMQMLIFLCYCCGETH